MATRDTNADWEHLARTEPYWSVLSEDVYKLDKLDDKHLKQFFASGEALTAKIFETIERHYSESFRPKRALDFGCGVGRLLIPLSKRCEQVVGVDVSETMLEIARENLVEHQ